MGKDSDPFEARGGRQVVVSFDRNGRSIRIEDARTARTRAAEQGPHRRRMSDLAPRNGAVTCHERLCRISRRISQLPRSFELVSSSSSLVEIELGPGARCVLARGDQLGAEDANLVMGCLLRLVAWATTPRAGARRPRRVELRPPRPRRSIERDLSGGQELHVRRGSRRGPR